ncbi:hypothetical protein ABZ746_38250 [Streptomyces sp. NPDC020096]
MIRPEHRTPAHAQPCHGLASLADTAVLRINPLPAQHLTTPAWRAAADRLYETAAARDALAGPACHELFDLIATAGRRTRGSLLRLKRDVYNGRCPTPRDLAELGALPQGVRMWVGAQQRWASAVAAAETLYPDALAAERAALARCVGDPDLRRSLALVAPQALDAMIRYCRTEPPQPGERVRKTERGIVQYLARAMVRTSPLSRLTAVGLYRWSAAEDTPGLDAPEVGWHQARSAVRVDAALFTYLIGVTVPDERNGSRPARVRRAPSVVLTAHHVQWHRPDGPRVRVLSAPLTRQLHTLMTLSAAGPRTVELLTADLARGLRLTPDAAARLVGAAVECGLLIWAPPLDEQAPDPVQHARDLLGDAAPRIRADLDRLAYTCDRFTEADAGERRELLADTAALGSRLTAATGRPARVHLTEDRLLPPGEVSPHSYREALRDLAGYLDLWSVFDRQLDLRELLARAVTDRIGPGCDVPLIDWADDLVLTVLRRESALDQDPGVDFGPADGSLTALLEARARIRDEVLAVMTRPSPADAGEDAALEAVLGPRLMSELAASIPARFRNRPASYAVLVQPVDGHLVVNDIYPGHGLAWSRFLTGSGSARKDLARRITALYGHQGVVLAEDRGLHGSGVNLRPQVLDHVLDADTWARIRLVHDAGTGSLTLRLPDGTPVRPVLLGMKWPELLPAPLRIATWMHDTGRIAADLTAEAHRRTGSGIHTTRHARLRTGRVIAQRARWYPGQDLPAALDAPEGAARMAALMAWRARHSVPAEVVLRTPPDQSARQGLGDPEHRQAYFSQQRRDKPQYVDLRSALMTGVAPRLWARRGPGYVEEALPAVRDGRRALEWIVEFDRSGHDGFAPTPDADLPEEL